MRENATVESVWKNAVSVQLCSRHAFNNVVVSDEGISQRRTWVSIVGSVATGFPVQAVNPSFQDEGANRP